MYKRCYAEGCLSKSHSSELKAQIKNSKFFKGIVDFLCLAGISAGFVGGLAALIFLF